MSTDHLQQIPENEQQRFKDQHTDDRIHQHLNNQQDEITEEDIRNVRTDIGLSADALVSDPANAVPVSENSIPANGEDVKDNTDPGIETPWNIIES